MATGYKLLCDKISFTSNDINPDRVANTCRQLIDLAHRDPSNRFLIRSSRWRLVRCSIPIPITNPHSTNRVRFEVGSRYSGHPDYRLEFNPSKIGAEGMDDLCTFIDSVTDCGAQDIISNGTVTRIDIALDLYGLTAGEVIVRSRGQQKHGIYSDRHGRPESIMLGTPRSNRTVAYTKSCRGADRKFLRIERRLKPRIPFSYLASLPDPFQKVQLVATGSLLLHLGGLNPEHFFDSVRVRGFGHVVKNLPPRIRRAVLVVLRDPSQSLLPSMAQVWAGWPQLLIECGFGPFLMLSSTEASLAPTAPTMSKQATSKPAVKQ